MLVVLIITAVITLITWLYYHFPSGPAEVQKPEESERPGNIIGEEQLSELVDGYRLSKSLLLFPTIQSGDIVVCIMPFSAAKLKTIEKHHRTRPYAVIQTHAHSLSAYPCTSAMHNDSSGQVYRIIKGRYNVWKDGWIRLNQTVHIPEEYVMQKLDTLSAADRKEINRLTAASSRKIKTYFPLPKEQPPLRPGCILKRGNQLFYYWRDEPVHVLLRMQKEPGRIILNFDSAAYYINPLAPISVKDLTGYRPVGSPVGSVEGKINDRYTVEITENNRVKVTGRKTYTPKKIPFRFVYPTGQILELGTQKVLYLYSAKDKNGTVRHYGITEEEAVTERPIVNEISYFSLMTPGEMIGQEELKEIIMDASMRKGKKYLRDLIE